MKKRKKLGKLSSLLLSIGLTLNSCSGLQVKNQKTPEIPLVFKQAHELENQGKFKEAYQLYTDYVEDTKNKTNEFYDDAIALQGLSSLKCMENGIKIGWFQGLIPLDCLNNLSENRIKKIEPQDKKLKNKKDYLELIELALKGPLIEEKSPEEEIRKKALKQKDLLVEYINKYPDSIFSEWALELGRFYVDGMPFEYTPDYIEKDKQRLRKILRANRGKTLCGTAHIFLGELYSESKNKKMELLHIKKALKKYPDCLEIKLRSKDYYQKRVQHQINQ